MKFLTILLITTVAFSSLSFAQESTASRSKQYVGLMLDAEGYGPNQGLNPGATLSLYLTSYTILDLEYLSLVPIRAGLYEYFTISGSSYAASIKQFLGNSFYVRIGGGNKKVDYKYETSTITNSTKVEQGRFKGNANFAMLAIGNMWSFSSFTVGCDWIGISKTLSYKVDEETISSTATTSNISTIRGDEDLYLKNEVPLVTRFYLGFAF